MKRRLFFLSVLALSATDLLFTGCYCDCDYGPAGYFQYCDIGVTSLDNSGSTPVIASDTVNREAFMLDVQIRTVELEATCSKHHASPFMSSAYASGCNCGDPGYMADNAIVSIRIYSDAAFSSNIPAGTDLKGLFYSFSGSQFITSESSLYVSYITNPNLTSNVQIRLMSPPEQSGFHQFTIEYNLYDGQTLTAQTDKIYLK